MVNEKTALDIVQELSVPLKAFEVSCQIAVLEEIMTPGYTDEKLRKVAVAKLDALRQQETVSSRQGK